MVQLLGDEVCRGTQSVRAVLTHLRIAHELTHVEAGAPSPVGPTLVDGKLRVRGALPILELLAETRPWPDAFADRPELRARERAAMHAWNAVVMAELDRTLAGAPLDAPRRKALQGELKELAQTIQATGKRTGSMLAFHVAPGWLQAQWLREHTPIAELIGEWIDVRSWLEQCAAVPAARAALASRAATLQRLRPAVAPTA